MEENKIKTNLNGDPITPSNHNTTPTDSDEEGLSPKTQAIEQNLAATAELLNDNNAQKSKESNAESDEPEHESPEPTQEPKESNTESPESVSEPKESNVKSDKPAQESKESNAESTEPKHEPENNNVNDSVSAQATPEKHDKPTQHAKKEKPESTHKKTWCWKAVCVVLLALVVGYCGGYVGGKNAANSQILKYQDKLNANQSKGYDDVPWEYIFGDIPSYPDNGDDAQTPEVVPSQNKAVLGIAVRQTEQGLVVMDFADGSKAKEAGLQAGDLIVSVDGKNVTTIDDLRSYLADKDVGDKVNVEVQRDGKKIDVGVELVENELAKGKRS